MKVKIVKEENSIKVFIDDKEIKNIKSIGFERENIDALILDIKLLTSNVEFIDNIKEIDNNNLLKDIRELLVIMNQKKPNKKMISLVEKIKKEIEDN